MNAKIIWVYTKFSAFLSLLEQKKEVPFPVTPFEGEKN